MLDSAYCSATPKTHLQLKKYIMTYPFIPIGLIAIYIVYVMYLLLVKKDTKKIKSILYPGLFFIAIWGVIYFFLLK